MLNELSTGGLDERAREAYAVDTTHERHPIWVPFAFYLLHFQALLAAVKEIGGINECECLHSINSTRPFTKINLTKANFPCGKMVLW